MKFFTAFWGSQESTQPARSVSREEFEETTREYDRKLEELNAAIHALRGDEPDIREQPHVS